LTLEAFASDDRARRLYEKLGYRAVGCVPRAVLKDGFYIDDTIMAKELEPANETYEHWCGLWGEVGF